MVLGVFKNAFDAESAVSNLIEAEFSPATISLVGSNHHEIQEIAAVKGSLQHAIVKHLASLLTEHGLDEKNASVYHEEVTNGNILVAIEAEPVAEDVAVEMLQDASALHVMAFADTLA